MLLWSRCCSVKRLKTCRQLLPISSRALQKLFDVPSIVVIFDVPIMDYIIWCYKTKGPRENVSRTLMTPPARILPDLRLGYIHVKR